MGRAVKGPVNSFELGVKQKFFKVDGTGTASITAGSEYATLTDNGVGDYTLTFTYPGERILGFSAVPISTDTFPQSHADTSSTKIRVVFKDDSGAATDTDFYLTAWISESQYEL